jgi:hypothetical protein
VAEGKFAISARFGGKNAIFPTINRNLLGSSASAVQGYDWELIASPAIRHGVDRHTVSGTPTFIYAKDMGAPTGAWTQDQTGILAMNAGDPNRGWRPDHYL